MICGLNLCTIAYSKGHGFTLWLNPSIARCIATFFHHLLFVQWQAARWCKGSGTKKAWSCDVISDRIVLRPRIIGTCNS